MRAHALQPSRWAFGLLLSLAVLSPEPARGDLQVVDPAGDPVVGATVTVRTPARSSGLLARLVISEWQAVTGEDGRAALELPAATEILLQVDHPEHAPWVDERAGRRGPGTIRLERGRSLAGRVRFAPRADRPGKPAAGKSGAPDAVDEPGRACARWSELRERWGTVLRWERCAALGPAGELLLGGLPDGQEIELTVERAGWLPARRTLVAESLAKPLDLTLAAGTLLAGVVLGGRGEPLPAARVAPGETQPTVETDARGGFSLAVDGLPVTLSATAPGFRTGRVRVEAPPTAEKPLVLRLRPAEQVTGLLVGDDGAPVPGASLLVEQHLGGGARKSERFEVPDETGEVRIDLPGPGTYGWTARADGYRERRIEPTLVAAGEVVDLGVIALERGAGVAGSVVDGESDEPLAGAEVVLVPLGTVLFEIAQTGELPAVVTGEDGRFEIFGLDGGRFEVRVRHRGLADAARRVSLERDERRELEPIVLTPGVLLAGDLTGRDGAPRGGLLVELHDPEASALVPLAETTSDGAGRFRLGATEPGRYRLSVRGRRLLLAREIEVPEGDSEMELDLTVGGVELVGRVVRGSEPVSGGQVSLASAVDPGASRGKLILNAPELGARAIVGAEESLLQAPVAVDGTFRIDDAPPGLLRATWLGESGSVTRQLLVPDRAQAEVVLDLGGLALRGRVVDGSDAPVAWAQIVLRDELGGPVGTTLTALDGHFELADLKPGPHRLEARAEGYAATHRGDVVVAEGMAPVEVRLDAGRAGSLEISLTRHDGSPLAFTPVALLDAAGGTVRALLTDAVGGRSFEGLPAGVYHVGWSDPIAGAGVSEAIPVEGGEAPIRWQRRLGPAGPVVLHCTAAACAGAPVALLTIHDRSGLPVGPLLSGLSSALAFSAEGALTLGRLAPGEYLLSLWVAGGRFQTPILAGPGGVVVAVP